MIYKRKIDKLDFSSLMLFSSNWPPTLITAKKEAPLPPFKEVHFTSSDSNTPLWGFYKHPLTPPCAETPLIQMGFRTPPPVVQTPPLTCLSNNMRTVWLPSPLTGAYLPCSAPSKGFQNEKEKSKDEWV